MTECNASLPSGIEICYETFGDPADPAVLLVMGLGCPMGWWSVEFCGRLVDNGFFVIRFDNRDTGRSTKVRGSRVTRRQVVATFAGSTRYAAYGISDMAADAFGVLDALDLDRAHVVGVSMGGMIAQTMALTAPDRVLSLTSIMSTTGHRTVGWQNPRLFPVLLAPAEAGHDGYVLRSLGVAKAIGSPGFALDEPMVLQRAEETWERGWSATGVLRQMMAVMTQPDRTRALRALTMPTCVIHGLSDPLVHPSGGRATARSIPGAELITIPGMGHDMPHELQDTFIDAITRTATRASSTRSAPPANRQHR